MATGKPVVANEEIPEHKDVLSESGGGVLVSWDEESFAEGIVKLLDDPKSATQMGQNGKTWVTRNRSFEVLARKIEEKYRELLK